MHLVAANALTSTDVLNPAGEKLGKITDFMLDTQKGCVVYAVLHVGGILGMGGKVLAVPPEALRFESGQRHAVIDLDAAALEAEPGFDRDNPPERANSTLLMHSTPGSRTERPRHRL